jgi:outer membrane lipoprotein SlyB
MTPRIRSVMVAFVLAIAAPTFTAVAAPAFAYSKTFVTIPAGTPVRVRLADAIHVNFATPGETYRAVLDRAVSLNRLTVIPRGSLVMLKAVGVNRAGSSDRVLLTARSVSFGGRTYEISTSDVQARGEREGRGPARRAFGGGVLGSAAGAIVGGGPGAAVGAAVGGTTGVAAGSRAGERVRISANTRFQFQLRDSVTVHH